VTSNPGFKVTGYLKVEYLADGARVFNCTKHNCRSLAALPKTCKKLGVVAEIFLAKSAGWCFTPVMEIKPNRVFVETSTQTYSLSEEGFGYNYGRLKSSASHASRENTLLRCGKIQKCRRHLQRRFVDGRTDGAYLGGRRCVGSVHSVVYNASAVTRGAGHMLSKKS